MTNEFYKVHKLNNDSPLFSVFKKALNKEVLSDAEQGVVSSLEEQGRVTVVFPNGDDNGGVLASSCVPSVQAKYLENEDGEVERLDMYVYSPVGYQGDSFEPQGAELIDDPKALNNLSAWFHASGHNTNITLYEKDNVPIAVPSDYNDTYEV